MRAQELPSFCCPEAASSGPYSSYGSVLYGMVTQKARRAEDSRAGSRSGPGRRCRGPHVRPWPARSAHRSSSRFTTSLAGSPPAPRPAWSGPGLPARGECGSDHGGDHGVRGTRAEPGLVQAASVRVRAVQAGGLAGLVQDPGELLPGVAVEPGRVAGARAKPCPARYRLRAAGWLLLITVVVSSAVGALAARRPEGAGTAGSRAAADGVDLPHGATLAVFGLDGWSGWPSARDQQYPRLTLRDVSSSALRAAATELVQA